MEDKIISVLNNVRTNLSNELETKTNKRLKEKIGKILLMNQQPKLAKKYFNFFSLYYFLSIVFQYINIYKLRRFFK